MNRRTFLTLSLIAAVLAVLAIVAQRGSDTASIAGASAGELLVPGLAAEIERIGEVHVTGAGDERLVSLARDGERWTVGELDDYPADLPTVNGLLIDLAEARIVEEKTANPDFFDRLGVEAVDDAAATGLELALIGEDGARFEIVLGDAYGAGERYARLADSEQSVLIDRNPEIAREAAEWVAPEIIDIAAARVAAVEIAHADGERVALSKSSADETSFTVEGIPEGRELQYETVADVTGGVLARLNLEAVAADTAMDEEPTATVRFRTFDGLIVTVTVREAAEGDSWLVFSASAAETPAAPEAGADAADDAAAAASAAAEAEAINARLGGWRYRIPAFKLGQLTRRMDDLLRDLPADEE